MNRRAFMAALGAACLPVPALPAESDFDQILRELEAKVASYNRWVEEVDRRFWNAIANGENPMRTLRHDGLFRYAHP